MRTRIEINPNLRIDGDLTIVDLDEDVYGEEPGIFEAVEVFEPASGMVGKGWVTAIDRVERTITLTVDWANLSIPETANEAAHTMSPSAWANLVIMVGDNPAPTLTGVNEPAGLH
jgi:hypothetical protein